MSTPEESPAQKAARLRRERREAKIREDGAARLDKITSLSGRASTSARVEEQTLSPKPSEPATPAPTQAQRPQTNPEQPAQSVPTPVENQIQSEEDAQTQQQYEYVRALLRGNAPAAAQEELEQDPMKLLNAMLGGMSQGQGGIPQDSPSQGASGNKIMGFSPAEITSILGLPPVFADILDAAMTPESPEAKKQAWIWRIVHVLFAFALGFYLLTLIGSSIVTYGSPPPPPATAQNPFVVFVTGELLLVGAKVLVQGRREGGVTFWTGIQVFKDILQDGRMVLFLLGLGSWWRGGWTA